MSSPGSSKRKTPVGKRSTTRSDSKSPGRKSRSSSEASSLGFRNPGPAVSSGNLIPGFRAAKASAAEKISPSSSSSTPVAGTSEVTSDWKRRVKTEYLKIIQQRRNKRTGNVQIAWSQNRTKMKGTSIKTAKRFLFNVNNYCLTVCISIF